MARKEAAALLYVMAGPEAVLDRSNWLLQGQIMRSIYKEDLVHCQSEEVEETDHEVQRKPVLM
jgi:hypothetical protein